VPSHRKSQAVQPRTGVTGVCTGGSNSPGRAATLSRARVPVFVNKPPISQNKERKKESVTENKENKEKKENEREIVCASCVQCVCVYSNIYSNT
jgi:hypothetical protein